jgi:acyl-CoA thioesterase II
MPRRPLDLSHVFDLEPHGPDTFVGESPRYEWGRIYGGLVIAQALWAASQSVQAERAVHSLHAYFILGGDPSEPVRYEVDRVRNGRSFTTRRVLARQSGGAILTLACSFQAPEPGPSSQSAALPDAPAPESLTRVSDAGVELAQLPPQAAPPGLRAWARLPVSLPEDPRLHACGLAYLSDVNAIGAIAASYPGELPQDDAGWDASFMSASLDHAMWFHRPARCDDWVLLDMVGHGVIGSRGLATGQVFRRDGTHVATIAQEGLLRERRPSG